VGESPLFSSRRIILSPRSARRSEPLPPPLTGAASAGATSKATREARPARHGRATHAVCLEPAWCAVRSRRVRALCCLVVSFRYFVRPPCPSPAGAESTRRDAAISASWAEPGRRPPFLPCPLPRPSVPFSVVFFFSFRGSFQKALNPRITQGHLRARARARRAPLGRGSSREPPRLAARCCFVRPRPKITRGFLARPFSLVRFG